MGILSILRNLAKIVKKAILVSLKMSALKRQILTTNKGLDCVMMNEKAGYLSQIPSLAQNCNSNQLLALIFSDSEHLSPTCGTYPLSCRPTILHGYCLGILHFPFGTAFHTICLHWSTSLFGYER